MKDNYAIIYCPRHKWFFHIDTWKKAVAALAAEGVGFDLFRSEARDSVARMVRSLVNNGYRTIVVMGGDTALRSAVQVVMEFDESTREGIAIGLLPNGVENDFAKFWRMEASDMPALAKALKRRKLRRIDVGHISYADRDGIVRRHYFVGSVNIGLIAREMNMLRYWKHMIGSRFLSYLATMSFLVFQRMEYKMHILINGSEQHRHLMSASIGNTLCYGLTPSASPYDGMLDVSLVHHPRVRQLVEGFYMLKSRKVINLKSVSPYRTYEINFPESPRCDIVVDGAQFDMPRNGFSVAVEPEMINFIIPL